MDLCVGILVCSDLKCMKKPVILLQLYVLENTGENFLKLSRGFKCLAGVLDVTMSLSRSCKLLSNAVRSTVEVSSAEI